MVPVTIEQFAAELKLPVRILLDQLGRAGVSGRRANDSLTDLDKARLLDYLRKQHGVQCSVERPIARVRTQTVKIVAAGSTGKRRTIHVEVRRKFLIVERDESEGYNPASAAVTASG